MNHCSLKEYNISSSKLLSYDLAITYNNYSGVVTSPLCLWPKLVVIHDHQEFPES